VTLPVTESAGGVQFAVKAVPGSARDRIAGQYGSALKIAVTAPPEQGRANRRILLLLAQALGVPLRAVQLLRGNSSAHKQVRVAGVSAAQLLQRLAPWLD